MKNLKTTDFIQNGYLTKLGTLTLILAITKTIQETFKIMTNENELKNITTKQN